MPLIRELHVHRFAAGTRRPLSDSQMDLPTSPTATVIEVILDDGTRGMSFTAGLMGFGLPGAFKAIREIVVGTDPFASSRTWEQMMLAWRKPCYAGEVVSSVSGVDLAIWDAVGKLLDLPLHRLWGGYNDAVKAYAAGGLYAKGLSDEGIVDTVLGYVEAGHKAVKIKIGRGSVKAAVRRVSAVRTAIGPDIILLVDANGAWQRHDAMRFLNAAEDLDLGWLEEPVSPTDVGALSDIRRSSTTAIAAGENSFTRFGAKDLLVGRAVDVLQIDACIGGGATEWLRVAALAQAFNVTMAPHGDSLIHLQLAGAIPNALMIEYDIDHHSRIGAFIQLPNIIDGTVELPNLPGLGLVIDWDYVKAHRVDA